MNLKALERRVDHRTPTYLPITLKIEDREDHSPAHLVDFSATGAGILTTEGNAPALGQFVDLDFDVDNTDGGTEKTNRSETGLVVNIRKPERGIARLGIRFMSKPELRSGLGDPRKLMSSRRPIKGLVPTSRWQTARHFQSKPHKSDAPVAVV